MSEASLRIHHRCRLFKPEWCFSSHQQPITLSLYTLSHPLITLPHPTMASNNNNKRYVEEEEDESFAATKKRL
jgi:hypothetical protein